MEEFDALDLTSKTGKRYEFDMRNTVKKLVEIAAETIPVKDPIYEFGALQVEGQEGFADLRPFFPDRPYVGCDIQDGVGVDAILDLHALDLPNGQVGTLLCMETLEHVEYPRKALSELYRVLASDGWALFSSHMNFPIHKHPQDFWRFTPAGFASLLSLFPRTFVGWAGDELNPHTVVGIGSKDLGVDLQPFEAAFEDWKAYAQDLMFG